ncbi:MAG: prepilin-type N-terminal cleavage/methylation domain-containing protein [Synechococcus sp. SB0678_bin_12]|nr:prepilin-type N-terminal cleavage/methylation domain-containing protein [Synechococcus sp. SB0678_bin_12]MYG64684.1 prepilin-type N-terminal cleavage/methylation domain-containing protein [Synechococcus sp. SB0675_bin_7]MYI88641.1 prepilin-type N-terminal cleavage/methylation domain-containing protein [Synechococcus sp. SB0672_bin_10]MYK85538.1 prepilin-type N-terminal cleavage/methylation domain-containing protein [Synechococcus sp. SB0669_bin_7]
MGKTVLPFPMVDRSQALKLTPGPLRQAQAGRWTPNVNPPTSTPAAISGHRPGPRPRRLPLRSQPWRQPGRKRPSAAAGFTLVELLIVVVIIGVLSSVAMPAFLGQQNKAKINAANIQARGLMSYCLSHFIDNGAMPNAGDKEYDRLAKDPNHAIIKWAVTRQKDKCEVNITGKNVTLSQRGIFAIQASGDATTIQATPARK